MSGAYSSRLRSGRKSGFSRFKDNAVPAGRTSPHNLLAIPPAKLLQLYGLERVSSTSKKIAESARAAEADYPKMGKFMSFASWTAINFGLVKLGSTLATLLSPLGGAAAAALGYTAAFIHPSCVSVLVGKLSGEKGRNAGVAEYLQARFFPGLLSQPVLFGSLGVMVHSVPAVGLLQGIGAVLASSFMSLLTWNTFFALYWARAIKRQEGGGPLENVKAYLRGLAFPFHKKESTANPYEDAGKIATALNYYWLPLSYSQRVVSAALAVSVSQDPSQFIENYLSFFALLTAVDIVGRGIETEKVEKMLKRNAEGIKENQ